MSALDATTCTVCHMARNLPPGMLVCTDCTTALDRALDQVTDALAEADITAARLDTRSTGGGASGRSSETPIPVNLKAANMRTQLWETVVSWSKWTLADDQRADAQPRDPVDYLRASTQQIRAKDWAADLHADIHDHLRAVMSVIDRAPETLHLGRCDQVTEGVPCPGDIRCTKGHPTATCWACGHRYDATALQDARVDAAWHVQAPLADIVKALNLMDRKLRLSTAEKWVERKHLRTPWQRTDGVRLYTMAQVRTAMNQQKSRARPRHRPRRVA